MHILRSRTARAVAVGTALVGGSVGVLGVEAAVTSSRARRHLIEPTYRVDHVAGERFPGRPFRIAVLGDSTVAGVGAASEVDSLPVQLATRAAEALGRPVHVVGYGKTGARVAGVLSDQVPRLREAPPGIDVVVVVAGGNDVTHFTAPRRFTSTYGELLDQVAVANPESRVVAVGAARFLDTFAVPRPLRDAWDGYSRLLEGRQEHEAAVRGIPFTDIARESSLRYRGRRDSVADDGFHPSVVGYGMWADAMLPQVLGGASGTAARNGHDVPAGAMTTPPPRAAT